MKSILVTGGCGFIGSNLVRFLLQQGYAVVNLDCLTYAGNPQSLADVQGLPSYRWKRVDITQPLAVEAAIEAARPAAILHLAAESHVDRSIDGPGQFIQTNIVGTYHLLQAALKYQRSLAVAERSSFRFIHVSTDEVYGSLGDHGRFTEETRYDPHSPYSASKAASDHLARAWSDTYGLPVIVTNCSNNYGPYQFPEKLIPVVILKCLRGESIPVYGKGENVRDWLYVEDHCRALQCVLEKGQPGATYNIGGDNERQNIELVRMLCGLMDELHPRADGQSYVEQITLVADRPGHDLRYAIDASKIQRELGWRPLQDHRSGFRRTVQWYLTHSSWWQSILTGHYRLQRQGLDAATKLDL
jgi:dTDP-glucose 4,6-dehydratase